MTKDECKKVVLDIIADIAPDEDLSDVKPDEMLASIEHVLAGEYTRDSRLPQW